MLYLKSILFTSGLVGLLAACSSPNPQTNPPVNLFPTSNNPPKTEPTKAAEKPSAKHGQASQGGQVVEVGTYHLELVTVNEESGIHIDLFLQNGNDHSAIPDAKVTAQVQMPDGTQKSLDLQYDAAEKHYAAVLSSTITGEYKVAVLTDIKGEKVNGRFSFKR